MKIKITITRNNKVLHVAENEVSQEGDIEKAIAAALSDARKKTGFGEQWGFAVLIDKA